MPPRCLATSSLSHRRRRANGSPFHCMGTCKRSCWRHRSPRSPFWPVRPTLRGL